MKITFLGGAGTVTGSKILVETNYNKILIDCGLFQGLKELRLQNWKNLPFDISQLDVVLLTHAHLDHSGYLPILTRNGFKGKIYCTHPTQKLTEIILLDSAKIQEEDAKQANAYSFSKHEIAKPLYTTIEAKQTIKNLAPVEMDTWIKLFKNVKFKFSNSGHILGSAFISLTINEKTIVFSGDLGRKKPIILAPYSYVKNADYLVLESTYGNRLHPNIEILTQLETFINLTYSKKGILVIPSFSVERAQEIIYLLSILKKNNQLPAIPIYLDSPMGVNATEVYFKYKNDHILQDQDLNNMLKTVQLIKDVSTSKAIVNDKNPKIVIAGSGMITGGRVLHYLEKTISSTKNSILMVGFQAEGTRGRALVSGEPEIKFFGKYFKVNADVFKINDFSGHADQNELLDWIKYLKKSPILTFINHGEPHQSQALKTKIKTNLNWNCTVAQMNKTYVLD